ncbi:MAG: hypothetical protein L6R40_006903 [Gallowayella cf. fulva]|nr:MAG: hypothetical protein L6R40_006903 [Xanthomendoza cf. fulva]
MSAKLDMALDDVVMTERNNRRRGRGGRRVANAARKAIAPVGGIQKNTRSAKGAMKPAVASSLASGSGESKIIVSNLPSDVTEKNVKRRPCFCLTHRYLTNGRSITPFIDFCSPFLRPDAERSKVELISLVRRRSGDCGPVWQTGHTSFMQAAVRKKAGNGKRLYNEKRVPFCDRQRDLEHQRAKQREQHSTSSVSKLILHALGSA